MVWLIFVVLLPIIVIIGGVLYFNIYFRKQIKKDTEPPPVIDAAYLEAEQVSGDDEDFGSMFGRTYKKEAK